MNLVVFSDLDGTLLDADSYSFAPALPALRLLRERNIPLVLVSSKTRAELEVWRQRLQNEHPFVAENGGGIFIPNGYFGEHVMKKGSQKYLTLSFGTSYADIRRRFVELRERLGIDVRGFGDMTVEEVASLTGLSLEDADAAKKRDFSEPFIFPAGSEMRFLQAVEGAKLRWTEGGRLFHLMGNYHKGRAVDRLIDLFEQQYGTVSTVGLGDSLNDIPFLFAVHKAVLISKKNGMYDPRFEIPGLIRTRLPGPAGWNEAIEELVKR